MKHPTAPFALPPTLGPDLARVLAYWEDLKRGGADMPFADDVSPSLLPELAARLTLIEVVEPPRRFRLAVVGHEIITQYGRSVAGQFVDELEVRAPLQYLSAQCSATVESNRPTFFAAGLESSARGRKSRLVSRLLLPTWGGGHVHLLLGAFEWS